MKAGAAMSTAEKWKERAEDFEREIKRLSKVLINTQEQRDELQDSLDHINELAAPDRWEEAQRINMRMGRIERMLEVFAMHFGIADEVSIAANKADQEPPENDEENEEDNGNEDEESEDDPPAARG